MMSDVFDFSSIINNPSELLIVKFALFFISFILIFITLRKFFDKKDMPTTTIISVSMSIMIIYFAPTELILNYFLVSYNLLGILTISFLSFFLFFFFLESFDFPLFRRVGFILAGIFYFVLGYYYANLFSLGALWNFDIVWIYYGIGCVSFFIVLFEKWVRGHIFK
jgi:hypothetical protein